MYYFGVQLIPQASSFKYLRIIIRCDLNWAVHVNYTLLNAWKALHFIMHILKKGNNINNNNNNTKRLCYTAQVRTILEYAAVCWAPYTEGQLSALSRVQQKAAKYANNVNESDS
jgi:hypothetical protein